jgi:threonine dehydrogenase-like Zn-dependent dehydrogenase
MKASVIREYGKIILEEVEKPQLSDSHVLVKVKYTGICGSDQHIFKG